MQLFGPYNGRYHDIQPSECRDWTVYKLERLIYSPSPTSRWRRFSALSDKMLVAEHWTVLLYQTEAVEKRHLVHKF